jgi:hypothetical protein
MPSISADTRYSHFGHTLWTKVQWDGNTTESKDKLRNLPIQRFAVLNGHNWGAVREANHSIAMSLCID